MKDKTIYIITAVLFTVLLAGTAFMQTRLKDMPQIVMLLFGVMTLAAFFGKQIRRSIALFYILIGTVLYINYFMLISWIIGLANPDKGWIEIDGQKHRVQDMSWIWGVCAGLILSPLTVFLYHKVRKGNRKPGIGVTAIFIIVTSIIYLVYKVL